MKSNTKIIMVSFISSIFPIIGTIWFLFVSLFKKQVNYLSPLFILSVIGFIAIATTTPLLYIQFYSTPNLDFLLTSVTLRTIYIIFNTIVLSSFYKTIEY